MNIQKEVKSSQIYLYSAFYNRCCHKAALQRIRVRAPSEQALATVARKNSLNRRKKPREEPDSKGEPILLWSTPDNSTDTKQYKWIQFITTVQCAGCISHVRPS